MAKEDIHNTKELLNRKADVYISQLFTEDQENTVRVKQKTKPKKGNRKEKV